MGSIQKLIIHGAEITKFTEITEKLNKYFSTVGSNLSKKIPDTEMLPTQSINRPNARLKFRKITTKQVYDLLGKLKNEKASGIDLIPNKVLKLAAPYISTFLAAVFKKCVLHGIFTDYLKTGKVVSIFKGDERHECGNYRSITVLSSLARIFEKIICNQLFDYFDSNNLLCDVSNWDLAGNFSPYLLCRKVQTVGC